MCKNPLGIEVGDLIQLGSNDPYIVAEISNEGYARQYVESVQAQSYGTDCTFLKIVEKRAKKRQTFEIPIDYKQINHHFSSVFWSDEKKEIKMKKCISEVYEKTAEAVLVEKYAEVMGIRNDTLFSQCVIKSNKAAFLAEAKRLEGEVKSK